MPDWDGQLQGRRSDCHQGATVVCHHDHAGQLAVRFDKCRNLGYTLIEMIVVVVVLGVMAAALAPVARNSLLAYDATLGNVVLLDKQRYAMERLAREIREVKYDSVTGFAFSTSVVSSSNAVSFTRVFYDGAGTPTADTVVTIGNTGSAVTLTYSLPAGVGAQVLTDELGATGNLVFSYFKQDGTTATGLTDVRYVEISLTLVRNGNNYPQRTRIELKNNS